MGYLFTAGRRVRQWLANRLYRISLNHSNMRVIVQNQEDLALFRQNRLAPDESLVLIPGSGVDVGRFHPCAERANPPIVLQTSRMLADKGVREFIAAARMLNSRFPNVRFVLVGAPDPGNPTSLNDTELRAAAEEGVIEWWGHRSDIPAILAQASIYCLPSYREGLPKSLIEAAATGLPLVTTDTSGCREVVRHGENGLIVPIANAPALADAIALLLSNSALSASLGMTARRDAMERFALEGIIEAQLALYKAEREPKSKPRSA
jgi:glycosyltransferase involved in cell wall biosynthesis